jgi:hypothetical protein
VKHAGTAMRSGLKKAIFNSIHLWGILPSAEERANMSPAEVQAFIAAAVAKIRVKKGYIHFGLDTMVYLLFPWILCH